MPAITHDTITSVDAFLAEIKLTSERGYGFDDCENQGDGRCLAVLIDGLEIPTAVSVSAPASRFAAEDAGRIAHQLRKQLPELARALHAVPR
jgi:IclR family acetate operon transcriptional repressor